MTLKKNLIYYKFRPIYARNEELKGNAISQSGMYRTVAPHGAWAHSVTAGVVFVDTDISVPIRQAGPQRSHS